MAKSLRAGKIESRICKKGFFEERRGTHHRYFRYRALNGTKTLVRTKLSHSFKRNTELGALLVRGIAYDLHITTKQFSKLIECPLSQADYEKHLRTLLGDRLFPDS